MLFKIVFAPKDDSEKSIEILESELGLDHVDKLRTSLDFPTLKVEKIEGKVDGLRRNCEVTLSEAVVRERFEDLFRFKNTHVVKVPARSLNKYVSIVANVSFTADFPIHEEPTVEDVARVWVERRIDHDSVLKDWVSAGADDEWDPNNMN